MTDFKAWLMEKKAWLMEKKAWLMEKDSRGKCNALIYITNISYINREGDRERVCFHSFIDSFKHALKDKPKSKPFSYGINTKHPLDDYPVNSLFCFVEDDYAGIDSLVELEKKTVWWGDHPYALREEVDSRRQPADCLEKNMCFNAKNHMGMN